MAGYRARSFFVTRTRPNPKPRNVRDTEDEAIARPLGGRGSSAEFHDEAGSRPVRGIGELDDRFSGLATDSGRNTVTSPVRGCACVFTAHTLASPSPGWPSCSARRIAMSSSSSSTSCCACCTLENFQCHWSSWDFVPVIAPRPRVGGAPGVLVEERDVRSRRPVADFSTSALERAREERGERLDLRELVLCLADELHAVRAGAGTVRPPVVPVAAELGQFIAEGRLSLSVKKASLVLICSCGIGPLVVPVRNGLGDSTVGGCVVGEPSLYAEVHDVVRVRLPGPGSACSARTRTPSHRMATGSPRASSCKAGRGHRPCHTTGRSRCRRPPGMRDRGRSPSSR